MNNSPSSFEPRDSNLQDLSDAPVQSQNEGSNNSPPQASYVKLAMRNMVNKGKTSLKHFFLTTVGFLALLIGLAYLTR
jgi:Protein of unknown function (DUF3285)